MNRQTCGPGRTTYTADANCRPRGRGTTLAQCQWHPGLQAHQLAAGPSRQAPPARLVGPRRRQRDQPPISPPYAWRRCSRTWTSSRKPAARRASCALRTTAKVRSSKFEPHHLLFVIGQRQGYQGQLRSGPQPSGQARARASRARPQKTAVTAASPAARRVDGATPSVNGYDAALDQPQARRRPANCWPMPRSYAQGLELPLLHWHRYINDEQICQAAASMWAKVGVKIRLIHALQVHADLPARRSAFYITLGWGVSTAMTRSTRCKPWPTRARGRWLNLRPAVRMRAWMIRESSSNPMWPSATA